MGYHAFSTPGDGLRFVTLPKQVKEKERMERQISSVVMAGALDFQSLGPGSMLRTEVCLSILSFFFTCASRLINLKHETIKLQAVEGCCSAFSVMPISHVMKNSVTPLNHVTTLLHMSRGMHPCLVAFLELCLRIPSHNSATKTGSKAGRREGILMASTAGWVLPGERTSTTSFCSVQ